MAWDEWCPLTSGDGSAVVAAELARVGRPAANVPEDADAAAQLLAAARAALLGCHDGPALVAASIVRTSGWPGATDIIAPVAAQTVDLALPHLDAADPRTDNDELVDLIQTHLVPSDELLIGWARDPSFGTLRNPAGSSTTGAEMLHDAADRLIWSLVRAAVKVTPARMSRANRRCLTTIGSAARQRPTHEGGHPRSSPGDDGLGWPERRRAATRSARPRIGR
jgi:hypothetical protein